MYLPKKIQVGLVPICDLVDLELKLSKYKKYAPYCSLLKSEIKFRYHEYYSTPRWKKKRKEVIERDKVCVVCGKPGQEVNHKTYDRFGHEDLNDLEYLCLDCHDQYTDKTRREKYKTKTVIIKNVLPNTRGIIQGGKYENIQIQNDRLGPIAYAQRANVGSHGSFSEAN